MSYADGTVVRYKPLGDPQRATPTYSIEIKKNPALPDKSSDDAAFKVDASGNPVPKGPFNIKNPFSKSTQRDQYEAFEKALMDAGHFSLTP